MRWNHWSFHHLRWPCCSFSLLFLASKLCVLCATEQMSLQAFVLGPILLFICLIRIKQIRKVRVDSDGKLIICFAFSVYAEVRMKTVHDETSESVSVSFLCPCWKQLSLWSSKSWTVKMLFSSTSAYMRFGFCKYIYIWYVCIFFFQRSSFGCHLLGCRSPLLRNKKPSSPALPKAFHPKIIRSNGLEITKKWHPKYLRRTPPSKKTARPRKECCTVLPVFSQF